ncbi:MAG TPA: ABC transporter ATP-binding protein [Acidimicrobiales bacterium]|nr:ABC transporter ATP-binding protein [Acidimicrobiales bacterium]
MILCVENLHKSYGDVDALRGVDIEMNRGEILGLLGPNGAGKTTLVSLVAGLLRPDAGRVEVLGREPVSDARSVRAAIGLAPQDLGVYPSLTVIDNVTFFARLHGFRGTDLRRCVDEAIELLALSELAGRRVSTLSGGEKRRVHTAMAIVHRPKLALLDEPTAGVDVQTRSRLVDAVRHLAEAYGTAICYSSHYFGEVEALDARIAILDNGMVVVQGTVSEVIHAHAKAALELTFDGPAPEWRDDPAERTDSQLRIYTDEPAADIVRIVPQLQHTGTSLRSVRIVHPTLESVFLQLTGKDLVAPSEPIGAAL